MQDDKGQPTDWAEVDPELLYGPDGWCEAVQPTHSYALLACLPHALVLGIRVRAAAVEGLCSGQGTSDSVVAMGLDCPTSCHVRQRGALHGERTMLLCRSCHLASSACLSRTTALLSLVSADNVLQLVSVLQPRGRWQTGCCMQVPLCHRWGCGSLL